MGSRYFQRPENAISKADEFIKVNNLRCRIFYKMWHWQRNLTIVQNVHQATQMSRLASQAEPWTPSTMSSRARKGTTPTGDKNLSSDNHGKDIPFTLVQLFSEKLIEEIMFRYLELCVDLKKSHVAKEGLFQYRNMCQVDYRL